LSPAAVVVAEDKLPEFLHSLLAMAAMALPVKLPSQ